MRKATTIAVLFFVLISFTVAAGAPRVLVVYSYDSEYAWNSALDKSIRETLGNTDCEQRYFYMDTRLRNSEEWKVKAGQMALDLLEDWQPDVVIACDDNAVAYFASKIPESAGVPVVFCGMNNDPASYGYPKPGVTGVLERPFPVASLDLCSEIVPRLKRVAFIGDETSTTDGYIDYIRQQNLGRYENAGFYKFRSNQNLQLALENLAAITDAFYMIRSTEFMDENGNVLGTKELMRNVMDATDEPVIGLSDFIVYDGALCGVVPDPAFHGSVSAGIALEIAYKGKEPSDFPIVAFESPLSGARDGLALINLETAAEKGLKVPVETMNKADVLVSPLGREEEILLEYYELKMDSILNDILNFLREVASTEYAGNGNWNRIKEAFLTENSRSDKRYSALYFYVKPDGHYYTHVRNYTGVSLKDRAYFPTLESGREVRGYPVISRSTGRKSAVFGVPVKKNGTVTGSIAMSVFMEELNQRLNDEMSPDNDSLLMAVNDLGTLMLSSREESLLEDVDAFIVSDPGAFMSILNENDSGQIAFQQGLSEYLGTFRTDPVTGWKLVYAKKIFDLTDEFEDVSMAKNLEKVVEVVLARINSLENKLMEAGTRFARAERVPDDVESVLESLYTETRDVYDISFIDTDGIIRELFPEERSEVEGADVSDHAVVKRVQETQKPVLSRLIELIEGFFAVDLEWPVFNTGGKLTGSLSLIIRPGPFFSGLIRESLDNPVFEVWLMQEDGTIIYDPDPNEIGKNIFDDEIYTGYDELKELGREILDKKEGRGEYTYLATGGEKPVSKVAVWKTLTLHEREWKVVLTKVE